MKILRRTKIRIETHERALIRLHSPIAGFCELCQTETGHLTVSQFARRSSLTERRVFQLAETGLLHGFDGDDGRFLICAGGTERTADAA